MSIIKTSVNRPVTVWMFMFAIILFGMVGFSRLAVKLLPDLSYPTITIRTQYIGAAPVEVEQLVSKPIEEAAGIVKDYVKSAPSHAQVCLMLYLNRSAQIWIWRAF